MNASRLTVSIGTGLVFLAGCALRQAQGDMQPQIGAPGAVPQSALATRTNSMNYKVLYSFGVRPDGAEPAASLIGLGDAFYGTTLRGGRHKSGTIFRITTSGSEKVLYRFRFRTTDGQSPQGGLTDLNDVLYGTTEVGGGAGGTVYSIATDGTEHVLHSFGVGNDGAFPWGDLLDVNGTLYGTTSKGGGRRNGGIVFGVTTGGGERVLHSFGNGTDGRWPFAGLVRVNETLYGTTASGGSGRCSGGCGTVFSVTTSGKERVLYSFGTKSVDGIGPMAGLVNVNGTLYGTTVHGGSESCGGGGCGTVFSITTNGTETVLHSFAPGADGAIPLAGLVDVNGTLYGDTEFGGSGSCGGGCGTIYSIATNGSEKVVYSFAGGSDGESPVAKLIDVKGTLYGTTYYGGTYDHGTVFALTP